MLKNMVMNSHRRRAGENGPNQLSSEKILLAAQRLFREKGYVETSTQEIADLAKVNKSTVYNNYKSKADLLFACARRKMDSILELAAPVAAADLPPEKRLEFLVTNHIKWASANLGLAGLSEIERRYLPPKLLQAYVEMRDGYEAIFRRAIEEVVAKNNCPHIVSRLAAKNVLGLCNSVIQWYRPGGPMSIDEVAHNTYLFIAGALGMPALPANS